MKKLAAYNRLIAYQGGQRSRGSEINVLALAGRARERSASPRSYVEPRFDPLPLQPLLTRFALPILVYAGTTQVSVIAKMGAF